MKIEIDRDACIGAGECVRLAPGSFEIDDDNVSVAVPGAATEPEIARRVERACPSGAIRVSDDPGS